ncbi:MAG: MoxR family ATPase [Lachnospiraceae bacterium]|nr:MoxR family ATPase [Lachnospiraceae bacterium]
MLTIIGKILKELKKAVSGKDQQLIWILSAILAEGHILLEDIPGVGKTTIALAFSKAMGLDYGRVQFTPDVLPSDITGYSLYKKETGEMEYQPGPLLSNLFLADELNRATSRTQSALLEAMEEGQVTVDGISHVLPKPFIVFATQNPTGAAGTQLLPDSQIDRFMIRLSIGYPSAEAEAEMVRSRLSGNPLNTISQIIDREGLNELIAAVRNQFISDEVIDFIVRLVSATRNHPALEAGASPRATLAVTSLSKAVSYINQRDYVVPNDAANAFLHALPHRIHLKADAEARGQRSEDILRDILSQVRKPQI